MILLSIAVFYLAGALHIPVHKDGMDIVNRGPIYWYITGPADFPLWYVRDLIVISFCTPLLHKAITKYRNITLIVLTILYLLPIKNAWSLTMGLFFFGLGYWLRIGSLGFLETFQKYRYPTLFLSVITLLIALYFNASTFHDYLLRLFFPFGTMSLITFFSDWSEKHPAQTNVLIRLSSSVFFIYAIHEIYISPWINGLYVRVLGESLLGASARYFLLPITVGLVCLLLYMTMRKALPRTLAFICGGRTQ
jgi:hypothetical protein